MCDREINIICIRTITLETSTGDVSRVSYTVRERVYHAAGIPSGGGVESTGRVAVEVSIYQEMATAGGSGTRS